MDFLVLSFQANALTPVGIQRFRFSTLEMANPAASGSGLFKFLRPSMRLQSTDIQAAASWGVAATTTALWLIQPFDWLKKTLFERSKSEEK